MSEFPLLTSFFFGVLTSPELSLAGSLVSHIPSLVGSERRSISLGCPDQSLPLPFPTGEWLAFFLSSDQSSIVNINSLPSSSSPVSVHLACSLFPPHSGQSRGLLLLARSPCSLCFRLLASPSHCSSGPYCAAMPTPCRPIVASAPKGAISTTTPWNNATALSNR